MIRLLFIVSVILYWLLPCAAQTVPKDYPVIGETIPEFMLNDVHYYANSRFSPGDAKGNWLILDFWNKYCTVCVESFPKINQLQNEFKDRIQFMLVGQKDKKINKNTKQVFERFRKRVGLELAIAYDSALFEQFKIQGLPHIVIVDPESKVYSVTSSGQLTRERLQDLVDGKRPAFQAKHYDFEKKPDPFWKYWQDRNDQRDFLYRSVLSPYQGEALAGGGIDQTSAKGYYHEIAATLRQLYNTAYLGASAWGRPQGSTGYYFTHWQHPILEINDSSLFHVNHEEQTGLYNYSLTVPLAKANKAHMMEVMQRDLKNYFGYEVSLETRMMPCWKLTATPEAMKNLPTKSQRYSCESTPAGITGKKITIDFILGSVERYHVNEGLPFLNETGISQSIDISFEAAMTDMKDVCGALAKHGLILEKNKKEMKVLVIRDRVSAKTEQPEPITEHGPK